LRRFESVRRIAPGAFSRNPESVLWTKDLRFALILVGAWRVVARSLPQLQLDVRLVSAEAREERGLQSGAKKS
jgi:hypothetical protein